MVDRVLRVSKLKNPPFETQHLIAAFMPVEKSG